MKIQNKHNSVNTKKMTAIEKKLGITIPKVYKEFLSLSDGAAFDNGILYGIDEIADFYHTLQLDLYAPKYISIGNDNGDCELVMLAECDSLNFGLLEQGSIGILDPEMLYDFTEWLESGCNFDFENKKEESEFHGDWSQPVQVILVKVPDEKAKGLMKIRKALQLETPIKELLSMSENTPVILTKRHSYGQVKKIMDENKELKAWLKVQ